MPEVCDPITQNGSHYIKWIHMLFGSCVYGNREAASLLLGFLSIACWLNAQSPQVIANYRNKSTDGVMTTLFALLLLTFNPMTTTSTYSPISTSSPSPSSLSQSQSLYLLQSSQTLYPNHDKILTPSLSLSYFENFFGNNSLIIGRDDDDKIPYILGAVGTLSFDVTIFLQWCVWKDRIRNDHQYPYRRARSATTHSHSSIGLSSSKRLSSSTHKLGYNTLPSNYHKTNFKKQLRSGAGSNDELRRSIILTNGELFV
nr:10415_t:CDS:2 [Entrophospora candida]